MLACQRDAYLRQSRAQVLQCQPVQQTESGGEQGSGEQGGGWALSLRGRDCVLYPEGGGQPWDLGTCGGQSVLRVQAGGDDEEEMVVVVVPAAVPVGTEVECVVDWQRRYDFMQQHTAQHLFSAVMWELFEADTVKWVLGSKSVAVDFDLSKTVLPENFSLIEDKVNQYIRESRVVSFDILPKDNLGEIALLRGAPKGAAANFEELRIVTIEGLDANPCGGTHVRSTAEIQVFSLIGSEVDRGSLRLRFLAGNRAIDALQQSIHRENKLSSLLSVPSLDHVSTVENLILEKKSATKAFKSLEDELSLHFAAHIIQAWELACEGLKSDATGVTSSPVIAIHRPGASLPFLQTAAECMVHLNDTKQLGIRAIYLSGAEMALPKAKASKKKKSTASTNDLPNYYVSALANNIDILNSIKKDTDMSGVFVLYGPVTDINAMKEPLCNLIQGKGGGRPGKLQGTATRLQVLSDVDTLLRQNI